MHSANFQNDHHPGTRTSAPLWWGLGVLTIGAVPLVLFILSDAIGLTKNSNPIGPGLLALFSFWPGVVLTVVGAALTAKRWAARG